jgi:hypothetical protein
MQIPSSLRVDLYSPASSDLRAAMLLQFISYLFARVCGANENFFSTTGNADGLSIGALPAHT